MICKSWFVVGTALLLAHIAKAMVRKVLRLKEALLAAQNTMNGIAQRLRAEGGTVDEAFTQQYAWLIDRIGAVDSTLKTCFETINVSTLLLHACSLALAVKKTDMPQFRNASWGELS